MSFLTASQTEPISTSEISELSLAVSTSPRLYAHGHDGHHKHVNGFSTPPYPGQAPADDLPSAVNMVIRQDPFTITLDAHALLAGSLFLLMGMHFLPRLLLESSILAVPIFLLLKNDYQNFLRLGPGGTPPTLAGYARLTWLRLFVLRDPFSPPQSSSSSLSRPRSGILALQRSLPYRPGPRPTVAGLAPQRQLNQHGSTAAFVALKATLTRLAAQYPEKFGTATSCLEKHGFALFSRHPVNVCGNGEVVHIHNSDHSMHLNLHPDDIAEVLAKGWSQRHPLAWGRPPARGEATAEADEKKGWLPWMRANSPLPETFVLVYAPRGEFVFTSNLPAPTTYLLAGSVTNKITDSVKTWKQIRRKRPPRSLQNHRGRDLVHSRGAR